MVSVSSINRTQWWILATVMLASFLGRLDGTIVNLALPNIVHTFQIPVTQASWLSTAYIISNAIFVPIFGKLGDLIGRKPLYLFGIIGFTLTSALAGWSYNFSSLIFFRVLQAITVSIDYPLALSIIAVTFTNKQQRAIAMGTWSGIFAIASVFGPLVGGPLIDRFGWRSVFYINIPLGVLGTLMAIYFIDEPVKYMKGVNKFDVLGALFLGLFLGCLVVVLDQWQEWGLWSFKVIELSLVATISLGCFLRVERKHEEPIVDLNLFRNRLFAAALLTSFISFAALMGFLFLVPILTQKFLGYSATQSGYIFIPMATGMFLSAQLGAVLSTRFSFRWLVALGLFWSAFILFLFKNVELGWGFYELAWKMFLYALGIGMSLAPLTNLVVSLVPLHEVGIASALLALTRNIAGAIGVAVFAALFSFSQINGAQFAYSNLTAMGNVFKIGAFILFLGGLVALLLKPGPEVEKFSEDLTLPEL